MTPREQQITTEYQDLFKDHVASFIVLHDGTEILEWRNKSGTNINWFTAVLRQGVLMIYGDLGEAIFRWYPGGNERIGFEFFSDCYLDYFAGKCCASETGRRYTEWDPGAVEEMINEYVADGKVNKEFVERADISDLVESCDVWVQWVWDNFNDLCRNADDEIAYTLADSGNVINARCIAFLTGIKMALRQRDVEYASLIKKDCLQNLANGGTNPLKQYFTEERIADDKLKREAVLNVLKKDTTEEK